ncbi:MAG: TolB family protein [Calditrichia bacterium]
MSNTSLAFAVPPEIQSLVSSAEAVVSAVDMDTIRQALTVTPTLVSGTIADIPSGLNRKFEIFVYDSNGVLTYRGEAFTNVEASQTIILDITLIPVNHTGTVIINGTFQQGNSGQRIVFLSNQNGSDDIYIMDGNGNNQIRLTATLENETHPHLSSDRSKICFTRAVNGLIRPFVMNADGQFILTTVLGNESGLYLIDMQDNFSVEVFLDESGVNEGHPHWR